jgi:hypothetical protein
MTRKFIATIAGSTAIDALDHLKHIRHLNELPVEIEIDERNVPTDGQWAKHLRETKLDGRAYWANRRMQVGVKPKSDLVVISIPDGFSSVDEALAIIEPLPFEICALGAVFFDEWIKADYKRWGFSRSHISHGWACAFRGPGHDRLVSRRWLDFGPWRVIRRPNDTTFVQFHDLAIADSSEAYQVAKVGHERMGCSEIGGFIQQIEDWMLADVRGLYTARERLLEIVVPAGETVGQGRMTNACTLRLHHRLTRPAMDPIERIAYIFLDEADARAHLHELWLRELECWLVDGNGKRRLDLDYHPVPNPPEWVKRLDGSPHVV